MQDNVRNTQNGCTSTLRYSAAQNDTQTHAAPLHDLTGFQRDLLRIIVEDSRPGLRIKEALGEFYGGEINHGRLYTNLNALIEKGFVQKTKRDGRTKEYSITTRGRREWIGHCNWLTQPLDSVESESDDGGDER